MELFETENDYIILDGKFSLWCDRRTGKLTPKLGWDLASAWNPSCLGKIYGIIGKLKIGDVSKLVLVKKRSAIGFLYGGHQVYSVNRIAVLSLSKSEAPDLGLDPCEKHHFGIKNVTALDPQLKVAPLQKTWNSFKIATTAQMKTATAQVKTAANNVTGKKKDIKDKEKFEKRVTEELLKMFSDNESFYFSPTGDLTNSIQRQCLQQNDANVSQTPVWKRVDDRFFWNKHMLQELIDAEEAEKDHWIVPMIQGYVDIETCHFDFQDKNSSENAKLNCVGISLISRRSRFRAGARYRRRGVDDDGKVANYVETEQIVEFNGHVLSFVQTRGSVPIYWSQPGYKYRPPPIIDKSEEDSNAAFEKHFQEELSIYENTAAVNLVDKTGRERVLYDAYLNHILNLNDPRVTYIAFDFHEYCRGMAFENVNILIMSIDEVIKEINYCWRDKAGLVCKQNGVFRVNCVDCLDRTNVVQTALGKFVIETQFSKLGVIPPEKSIPNSIKNLLQTMWANNGDSLSRQYAGTAALKGDFTRTGERGLTGVMKDSYTSANRYYLNRFKDAYRQVTIDCLLGNPISEEDMGRSPEKENSDSDPYWCDHIKQLLEDCKKILVPENELIMGAWAVIDADPDTGDPNEQDADIVLVLTRDSYYVAEYDGDADRITKYQRVHLEDLEKIELGQTSSLFRSKYYCIRLNYLVNGQPGYFHMFRSTNVRFFNNMVIAIKTDEEVLESLKAICDTFIVALEVLSINIPFYQGKLEKKRSKMPFAHAKTSLFSGMNLELPSLSNLPRNVSEGQLIAFKNAGSKAISNVTSFLPAQFAKLNPLKVNASTKKGAIEPKATESITRAKFHMASSDSDEENIVTFDVGSKTDSDDDFVLDSCGILANASPKVDSSIFILESSTNSLNSKPNEEPISKMNLHLEITNEATPASSSNNNTLEIDNINHSLPITPEIHICVENDERETKRGEEEEGGTERGVLSLLKKLSHSTEAIEKLVDSSLEPLMRSSSPNLNASTGVAAAFKTSHSEGAIKEIPEGAGNVTSPSAYSKDLVMGSLTMLSKGVQNLGMNIQKATGGYGKLQSEISIEKYEEQKQRRRNCRSRIYEL